MADQKTKAPAEKTPGREKPKPVIDERSCIGCGICAEACPLDAITMKLADGTIVKDKEADKEDSSMAKKAYVLANRAIQMGFKDRTT